MARRQQSVKTRHTALKRQTFMQRLYKVFFVVFVVAIFSASAALYLSGWPQQTYAKATVNMDVWIRQLGFMIKGVDVDGRYHVTKAQFDKVLGDVEKTNIFSMDVHEARSRLESMRWVSHATVRRQLPNRVHVRLVEKEPMALVQSKGGYYIIDTTGYVLSETTTDLYPGLLIVSGANSAKYTKSLIETISRVESLKGQIQSADFLNSRRWNLLHKDGILIKLPEEGMDKALRRFADMVDKGLIHPEQVAVIDLRLEDRTFLQVPDEDPDDAEDGEDA